MLKRQVLKLVVIAASLWLAVEIVEGLTFTGDIVAFAAIAGLFWLINTFVKPIVKLLSLPAMMVSFGLFVLIINFLMSLLAIWLSGVWNLGLASDGHESTLLGALVVSVVSMVLNWMVD